MFLALISRINGVANFVGASTMDSVDKVKSLMEMFHVPVQLANSNF